ncbi:hypothetical protein [Flagellimonas sp. 2504JD4-2]
MGVTIHFEGKLNSEEGFHKLIETSVAFAQMNEMDYQIFEETNKRLQRVKDEKEWDYRGSTRGIKIQPDINSDPLWLEFDEDNFIQEFCKTQFSSLDIHIKIIEILNLVEPYFQKLLVEDEGEYWMTRNTEVLKEHFDNFFRAFEDAKSENPNLSGPFRVKGGRIVDLMDKSDN